MDFVIGKAPFLIQYDGKGFLDLCFHRKTRIRKLSRFVVVFPWDT
jgi:hypothetical protein